jgi:nucleotide-binding universal stress UspA family protein
MASTDTTSSGNPEPLEELHLRRLLVAVDGSESSDLALAAAVTAARRENGRIMLISVASDVLSSTRWPVAAPVSPTDLQDQVDADTNRMLREAAAKVPEDVPVTRLFRRGSPGPAIVDEARKGSYDAVLMGARGVGRVAALMGSVSQHVLHNATTPVFVAHAPR